LNNECAFESIETLVKKLSRSESKGGGEIRDRLQRKEESLDAY